MRLRQAEDRPQEEGGVEGGVAAAKPSPPDEGGWEEMDRREGRRGSCAVVRCLERSASSQRSHAPIVPYHAHCL
jgi:hypothetical protein